MTQPFPLQNNYLKRIIVVVEEPSLRVGIVNSLMLEGYTVTGVDSALDFYLQFFREPYLIAIIDNELPDQSGLVVAEYARKNADIHIITLSEPLTSTTVPANFEDAADLNIIKPVNIRLLSSYVRTLLSRLDS